MMEVEEFRAQKPAQQDFVHLAAEANAVIDGNDRNLLAQLLEQCRIVLNILFGQGKPILGLKFAKLIPGYVAKMAARPRIDGNLDLAERTTAPWAPTDVKTGEPAGHVDRRIY